jgi:hypothetical protein
MSDLESAKELEPMASDWLGYADRFGIIAEIVNGRYTDAALRDMAGAFLWLIAEVQRLREEVADRDKIIRELWSTSNA